MTNGQDTLDIGMIPDGVEQDSGRFHHVTQKDMQVKTYELFITEIFHLIFLDHGLTSTVESKITSKGGLLYLFLEKNLSPLPIFNGIIYHFIVELPVLKNIF